MTSSSKRKALRKSSYTSGYTIFQFKTSQEVKNWGFLTDRSFGGNSWGLFESIPTQVGFFCGSLSNLEKAFLGIRSPKIAIDCSEFSGFTIRVRGDRKKYRFVVFTHSSFNQPFYQAELILQDEEWHDLYLPFDQFTLSLVDTKVETNHPLTPDGIHNIGFLIADRQSGPFGLEIDWIKLNAKADVNAPETLLD